VRNALRMEYLRTTGDSQIGHQRRFGRPQDTKGRRSRLSGPDGAISPVVPESQPDPAAQRDRRMRAAYPL